MKYSSGFLKHFTSPAKKLFFFLPQALYSFLLCKWAELAHTSSLLEEHQGSQKGWKAIFYWLEGRTCRGKTFHFWQKHKASQQTQAAISQAV